jgi:hypothetical protein
MAKRAQDFGHLSIEELERRLEAYHQDGDPGRPWREVLEELERLRE